MVYDLVVEPAIGAEVEHQTVIGYRCLKGFIFTKKRLVVMSNTVFMWQLNSIHKMCLYWHNFQTNVRRGGLSYGQLHRAASVEHEHPQKEKKKV